MIWATFNFNKPETDCCEIDIHDGCSLAPRHTVVYPNSDIETAFQLFMDIQKTLLDEYFDGFYDGYDKRDNEEDLELSF